MIGNTKISDWKWLERIEVEIDCHHSGEQDATESLEFIAQLMKNWEGEKMTNQELVTMVQRGEQAALLVGQIHGKIHNILSMGSPANYSDVRNQLIELHRYIGEMAGQLYYKAEVKDENVTN